MFATVNVVLVAVNHPVPPSFTPPSSHTHTHTHARSHESAKLSKLFNGYKVYLTPNIKPQREQIALIVKSSGGEPLDFSSPIPPGDRVVIVTCEDDLGMCRDVGGVPVCSTELVLKGVLRQEVDVDSYPLFALCVCVAMHTCVCP